MHAYTYKINFPVGLSCLIIHDVIILSEQKKKKKKDSLKVIIHPSIYCDIRPDVPSSAGLTCFAIENTLLLPHLKQV